MAFPNGLGASALHEALSSILSHGLEQSVAKPSVALLDRDEALVYEGGQQIEHRAIHDVVARADTLRRLERPPSCKYRQTLQQELLRVVQELVTPVDERAQRL